MIKLLYRRNKVMSTQRYKKERHKRGNDTRIEIKTEREEHRERERNKEGEE
jgi:hypothetical protein